MDRSLYTKSILIGGLTAGVLSAIPGVQIMNCCCCGIWVILGGLVASYVFVHDTPSYPRDGDGALVGLGAGAVAGIMASTANTIVQLVTPRKFQAELIEPWISELPGAMADQVRMGMEQQTSPLMLVVGMFFAIIFFSAVSALGGLIGMRLFRPLRMLSPASYQPAGPYGGPYAGPYAGGPYPGPQYYAPPPGAPYPGQPAPAAPAPSPSEPSGDPVQPGDDEGPADPSGGPGGAPWGGA